MTAGCGSSTAGPPDCGSGAVGAGLASDVPMNGAVNVMTPAGNVFICRDAQGLYALDAGCTHLGCDVNFVSSTSGFLCPCHGATFDFNGQKPTSPAPRPLRHYELCVQASGTLLVDLDTEVDPTVRLKA